MQGNVPANESGRNPERAENGMPLEFNKVLFDTELCYRKAIITIHTKLSLDETEGGGIDYAFRG